MKTKRKVLKKVILVLLSLVLLGACCVLGINLYVKGTVSDRILSQEQAAQLKNVDCILVLGCLVHGDGSPSHMLEDRIKRGVALYEQEAAPKLLMSGDHGQTDYDEVNTMKKWAVDQGVPSEAVFMDHAGFSTYESVYRAKEVFKAKRVIIVSQDYHLYRALYVAKRLGLEAWGVSSNYRTYAGQTGRDIREVLARCKDFALSIFKPEPTYLGKPIPISGNGDVTTDQ